MVDLRPLDEGAKPAFDLMYKLPSNLTSEVLAAFTPKSAASAASASASVSPKANTSANNNVAAGIAAATGVAVGPLVAATEIVAPIPKEVFDPTFPAVDAVVPPPSYETQRMLAKMMAGQLDEKQRFALQQEFQQQQQQFQFQQQQQQQQQFQQQQHQAYHHQYSPSNSHSIPPLYSSPPQHYQHFDGAYKGGVAPSEQQPIMSSPSSVPTKKAGGASQDLTTILMVASVLMASSPMALVTFVPLLALLLVPEVSQGSFQVPVPQQMQQMFAA
ncbi:hypothetical protein FS842_002852 [Serendipita sp. 407]|nr:hypothetical protein FS842_002852 [Serendipita sp. 407]